METSGLARSSRLGQCPRCGRKAARVGRGPGPALGGCRQRVSRNRGDDPPRHAQSTDAVVRRIWYRIADPAGRRR